jgi:hypothetical protein
MTPYVPNCSIPLLFEGVLDEAPYGMAGTGFLIRCEDSLYFSTAAHCLEPGDHNRLRLPETYQSNRVLTLKQFGSTTLPPGERDTDYADFALFSVEPVDFGPRDDRNLEPAYLPRSDTTTALREHVLLTIRGYPKAAPLSGIDYGRRVVTVQALICDAAYLGSAESQHCHKLQFVSSCPVNDFDHLSGSPVFAKLPHQRETIYVLVGLLLRAGGPQRFGRFVSIEVVREGIRRFEAAKPLQGL